jgi:hypothetical protein
MMTERAVNDHGFDEKGIQIPMAQGRSTTTISMIEWIRTSRFSTKNSLSLSRRLPPIGRGNVTERLLIITDRAAIVNDQG